MWGDCLAQNLWKSAIEVHEGRKVESIKGDGRVKGLVLDDGTAPGVNGIFIEQGSKGAVGLAGGLGVSWGIFWPWFCSCLFSPNSPWCSDGIFNDSMTQ